MQEGTARFHRVMLPVRNNNIFLLGENVLGYLKYILEFSSRFLSKEAHLFSVSSMPVVGAQQALCEFQFPDVDILENGENATACVFSVLNQQRFRSCSLAVKDFVLASLSLNSLSLGKFLLVFAIINVTKKIVGRVLQLLYGDVTL